MIGYSYSEIVKGYKQTLPRFLSFYGITVRFHWNCDIEWYDLFIA